MPESVFHIFLPHHFLIKRTSYYLYGCFKTYDKHVLINCVFACPLSSAFQISSRGRDCPRIQWKGLKCQFGKLGRLTFHDDSRSKDNISSLECSLNDVWISIRVNQSENEIMLEQMLFAGKTVLSESVYLIIYNGSSIKSSELLWKDAGQNESTVFKGSFVQFVAESIDLSLDRDYLVQNKIFSVSNKKYVEILCPLEDCDHSSPFYSLANVLFLCFQCVILLFGRFYCLIAHCFSAFTWPPFIKPLLFKSTVVRQLHQRLLHVYSIFEQMQRHSISLCSKNIIVAILLDLLFGWLAVYYLRRSVSHDVLLRNVMIITNEFVNWLQGLIYWLMGVPAGLKLNIPLNSVLGHIFLYHIYLWKTYIVIVLPVFEVAFEALTLIGALGFTFVPSLLSDFVSVMTVHIYCFYGYASRLYYYQLCCLTTLWRLFRGKKWNPENQRVESFTYGVHELYIGTLLFTVLLFLLPTVMVYYFVFTALRIVVLIFQGLLLRTIRVLTVLPIYVILLRMCNSVKTTGGVQFSVLKSDLVLILSMELIQGDMLSVVKLTLPSVEQYEQSMSWKSLMSSLLWGKLIYPI